MLTDLIARTIAGQLKCSPECTDYPEGCGCAQNATAAVEKALADAGYVVVPKEPTDQMWWMGMEMEGHQGADVKAIYRAMIAAR